MRGRVRLGLATLAAAVVASGAFACGRSAGSDAALWGDVVTGAARVALPLPNDSGIAKNVRREDFAGAAACAGCHAEQSAAWRRSTHGRAGGAPSPAVVIAPFDGTVIRFRDATVVPSSAGGAYTFTVRRANEPDVTWRVDAVVGGGHMRGGGTQGFATRWRDGTLRFLPFDWSRTSRTWFCNTTSRGAHGWTPITAELPITACADWTPNRVLGDEPRFTNCQGCHASRVTVALDTAARAYRTELATLAIDCESCHGPGRAHATSPSASPMAKLASLGKDASIGTCASCHAVKARLAGATNTYLPGGSLGAHYSPRLAVLGDSLLYPDGRTRTFAYQEGHLWSDCYVNGPMTCTSCHDPHSQGYRDLARRPLTSPYDDGQCTGCHANLGATPAAVQTHTKHAATSAGSRCVACHMPYLQEAAVGARIPYGRSDHTTAIPRPAYDDSLGVPNACASCHRDRSVAQLESDERRLWGEIKPHPAPVVALTRALRSPNDDAATRALLDTTTRHVAAQYASLALFAERLTAPDVASLDEDVLRRLRALARSPDVDVRALALATLHYAGGERVGVRHFLAERLTAEREGAMLRARWATALGALADAARGRGDARGAATVVRKALEVRPDDARLQAALGQALTAAGDAAGATAAYERSLALDPLQPLVLVDLGVAREGAQDAAGAVAAYQRALALNAHEPLALANLGNAYLRAGDPRAAVPLYERALAEDGSLASVHFSLAQALGQQGDAAGALKSLRRGLAFDSSDANVRGLADELARRLGAMP